MEKQKWVHKKNRNPLQRENGKKKWKFWTLHEVLEAGANAVAQPQYRILGVTSHQNTISVRIVETKEENKEMMKSEKRKSGIFVMRWLSKSLRKERGASVMMIQDSWEVAESGSCVFLFKVEDNSEQWSCCNERTKMCWSWELGIGADDDDESLRSVGYVVFRAIKG